MYKIIVSLFLSLAVVARAADSADQILALPGWTGALPSKQYSGYLNASDTTRLVDLFCIATVLHRYCSALS